MDASSASIRTVPGPWLLPEEPAPVRLMNTVWADREGLHDALSTPDALAAWLAAVGLPVPAPVDRADLARALRLRDALRRLAAVVATPDDQADAACQADEAAAVVNATLALDPRPPSLVHAGSGWHLVTPPPAEVGQALARLAAEAAGLVAEPVPRLRACHGPGCVLFFVQDHPRRAWCSAACGNRARVARHYARRRHPSAPGPDRPPDSPEDRPPE